jgi:hypothetical protein
MPRNPYLRPAGQWYGTDVLNAPRMSRLDQSIFEAINAAEGGTWTPLTPVKIGGAGISLTSTSSTITGDIKTLPNSGGVKLGDDDHITFASARTRNIFVPFCNWNELGEARNGFAGGTPFYPRRKLQGSANNADYFEVDIFDSIRMHNGATITGWTVHMRVNIPHFGQSLATPSIRSDFTMGRVGTNREAGVGDFAVLYSAPLGIYTDPETNATAYYNAGNVRDILVPCDQNNVINTRDYSYLIYIRDSQDPLGSMNEYIGATLHLTNITNMAPE